LRPFDGATAGLRGPAHSSRKLSSALVLAHAGAREFEQARIAELGDAGGLPRIGDLVDGLAGGGVEHGIVGGAGLRQRLRDAAGDGPRRGGKAGDADRGVAHAAVAERGLEPIDHVIGRDDTQGRATFGGALGVPCRRHDQARLAVTPQHDGGRPQGLEAAQHQDRIGRLDEMRAVVNRDQQIELLLGHVATNCGEPFVEGHDVVALVIIRLAGVCPGCGAARSTQTSIRSLRKLDCAAERCTADPGPPRTVTVPGLQRTNADFVCAAALRPGHP